VQFFIRTYNQPVSIWIDFETNGNDIIICSCDPDKKNTEYFSRLVNENGIFEFNLPVSPQVLKVIVFETKEGNIPVSSKYKLTIKKTGPLSKPNLMVDADTAEFIKFAQDFSQKAGYAPVGDYYSQNNKFNIKFLADIQDDPRTPSRIHKYAGYIEVSKKWFDDMTIPGRMAILLHEFSHNHLESNELLENNDIEIQADEAALQLYRGLGYPKVEWLYVWDFIFSNNEAHNKRLAISDINLRNSV
jgi:hypothetical protein